MSELDPNATLVVVDKPSTNVITRDIETSIAIEGTATSSVVSNDKYNVIVDSDLVTTITTSGGQGPAGPPGDSINYINILAGHALSGHRVVCTNDLGLAVYADNTIAYTADRILGITTSASLHGTIAEVQIVGVLEEPSWAWDITIPLYVGTSGFITQTVPATGYLYPIGFAMSPTKIFINKQPPIILG